MPSKWFWSHIKRRTLQSTNAVYAKCEDGFFLFGPAEVYELSYDPKRGFSNDATERFDYEGWI